METYQTLKIILLSNSESGLGPTLISEMESLATILNFKRLTILQSSLPWNFVGFLPTPLEILGLHMYFHFAKAIGNLMISFNEKVFFYFSIFLF